MSRPTTAALTALALDHPKQIRRLVLVAALIAAVGFGRLQVDTDPENMLPADDPVRARNAVLADELGEGPLIVVGLLGDVRSPEALGAIDRVHAALAARDDVVASSTVSVGSTFDRWPFTPAEADAIVAGVDADPILGGNALFAEHPGGAIFVTLTAKDAATSVADAARDLIAAELALAGVDVAVAGQPLAEDAFGVAMFVQMAIFAPLAGMAIFAILYVFFRRLQLVIPAMLVAMATVVITMGALIGTGNTVHIMSSMIPIFLMPIAILDSVHVLSEFFDRYDGRDRRATIAAVIDELRRPIGYTTLTTAVGFGALVLVPIPPVQVFGLFVALGVGVAWLLTLTLIPAYLIAVDDSKLAASPGTERGDGRLARFGATALRRRPLVLGVFAFAALVAVGGLATLNVNDNPVRWFRADHEIRQASDDLAAVLPGTFPANLLVTETTSGALDQPATQLAIDGLADHLRALDEVGAVQSYIDAPHPALRSGELANIRLQLHDGDNISMQTVVDSADEYLAASPIAGVDIEWAGTSYLNLTWQQKMVSGMLVGFATTLVVVFGLLVALFRSFRWALLAIAPVLWTVAVVYGAMALVGRDIDMPVAVLSTMVLGIGVDFAIHFVERFRELVAATGSASAALSRFYGEPARALSRNAAVIALGFAPLLVSSLVPYVVVGALLATIVGLSWLCSIVVLPLLVADRSPVVEPAPRGAPAVTGRLYAES